MALDRIKYDVIPYTRELDELGNLFYVERLVLETNTNGNSVTPTLGFEAGDVVLSSVSNTSRGMLEVAVNRLGPLNSVELAPVSQIDWYGVELFVRPVMLGVNIVERGQQVVLPGRTSNSAVNLIFDINAFSFPEDARHINPIVRRLFIDIETGAETVTPTLNFDGGGSITLSGITLASRAIIEFAILNANRVKNITLAGDFSSSDVILYDIEIDIYIPSQRRLAVG
jgi:hypothetical protein